MILERQALTSDMPAKALLETHLTLSWPRRWPPTTSQWQANCLKRNVLFQPLEQSTCICPLKLVVGGRLRDHDILGRLPIHSHALSPGRRKPRGLCCLPAQRRRGIALFEHCLAPRPHVLDRLVLSNSRFGRRCATSNPASQEHGVTTTCFMACFYHYRDAIMIFIRDIAAIT